MADPVDLGGGTWLARIFINRHRTIRPVTTSHDEARAMRRRVWLFGPHRTNRWFATWKGGGPAARRVVETRLGTLVFVPPWRPTYDDG